MTTSTATRAAWTLHLDFEDPIGLSPREAQVLGLVAAGRSLESVARGILLPVPVVGSFLTTAMSLIGASDRREALRWALDRGLLVPGIQDSDDSDPLGPDPSPTAPDEVAA